MKAILDYTVDLRELAALAAQPEALDAVLGRALDSLQALVPYDLAAVLELEDGVLRVRVARGLLASEAVRRHSIRLADFPSVQAALERRKPVALLEQDHSSGEGDPYDGVLDLPDGHSCMVVPLFAANRILGVMTFDRGICVPYEGHVLEIAGVYAQLLALAMLFSEQAELLGRYRERLEERNRLLAAEARPDADVGQRLESSASPLVQRLARQARQVALTDTPVLILGETGSGKEVLALAIHGWSHRRLEAFVKLNCAAIPENLVESELFGHVKGAFSGATASRPGRFAAANGGTLFLDEIGDMPLGVQAKLLRVLQEGTFEPVGSDRTVKVDVRVLAATNVNLENAVRQGRFREDLFYRLDVFPLRVPTLRERPEDILPLARELLAGLARRTGRGPWTLAPDAEAELLRQDWRGNVRQLLNTLERATILRPSGVLDAGLVAGSGARPRSLAAAPSPAEDDTPDLAILEEVVRRHVARVLRHTGGRIYGAGGAAQVLGLKPTTLQSRMKKLGLERQPRNTK